MIYNSIIETIGNTPMIRLNKLSKGIKGEVLVKVEYFNPGNSMKDRMAISSQCASTSRKRQKIGEIGFSHICFETVTS